MTSYIDPRGEQLKAFASLPDNGNIFMLNLLRFKDKVEETGQTGQEAYKDYMEAATPFIAGSEAKVVFYGTPFASLIGPEENEWDKCLIVQYPNKKSFLRMISTEGYPAHLRARALADSRLICMNG
ncbi:MAG: DUF1330 domain-containing protein [Bacteroidota bacterium]